tara:strand:+ start:4512 stop:6737 length:2226 start_codon:yes stop_codon:yes gene_type:complete
MNRTSWLLYLFLFLSGAINAVATEYWISPSGDGSLDGTDAANAMPKSQIDTVLNTTMGAGDTLFLLSGDYGSTQISLSSDGAEGNPKRIVGVDSGSGLPHFSGNGSWGRDDPDSGQWQIIGVYGHHWVVEGLELSGVRRAITNSSGSSASSIHFKNLDIHDVRHGLYIYNLDDSVFEDVKVTHYTKHAYRLEQGCDDVMFLSCLADMTDGDTSWWAYAELYPFGFLSEGKSVGNTNISFVDCISKNNRKNLQDRSYWNGDGFVVEGGTTGVTFENCISLNNEDGGFDLKPEATIVNCVAFQNYRGFRLWGGGTITNSVAGFPYRRADHVPDGVESTGGSGIWTKNGTPSLDYFTFYGNKGRGAHEEGSGSISLTNSILAFSGAEGSFTIGSVSLGAGTVTYKSGSGVDPDFVNPQLGWDGIGDDMNSQTYEDSKGYFRGALGFAMEAGNLSAYTSGQSDGSSTATLDSTGTALTLSGNIWRKYPLSYDITGNTVMQLSVESSDVGEIIAIGLDNDNDYEGSARNFKLGGSQSSVADFHVISPAYGAGTGIVCYRIPVGGFYTGSINYLTFIADDDDDQSAEVTFSRIEIFESPAFDAANLSDYGNQTASGTATLEQNDTAVHLEGNIWRKYPFTYTFTANTMLEVTVDASEVGEVIGIGFDTDNSYTNSTTNWMLGGSQALPSQFQAVSPAYSEGEGAVTYVIPVGSYFTGTRNYITLIADDDAAAAADVVFSDIRVYEAP